MLLIGVAGHGVVVRHTREEALHIARKLKGVPAGSMLGRQWYKKRFHTPYLRNTLWDMGYAVDTVETATTWDQVSGLTEAIEASLRAGLAEEGEQVHAFSHLSHVYPHGSAIYTTYLYRLAPDPQETLRRWQILKRATSQVIVAAHATISHHHGVGIDHQAYLGAEKGALGLAAMRQLYAQFDPQGLMNPGKLV
jgi:alkyldihydroxyacetonephosphate synthase